MVGLSHLVSWLCQFPIIWRQLSSGLFAQTNTSTHRDQADLLEYAFNSETLFVTCIHSDLLIHFFDLNVFLSPVYFVFLWLLYNQFLVCLLLYFTLTSHNFDKMFAFLFILLRYSECLIACHLGLTHTTGLSAIVFHVFPSVWVFSRYSGILPMAKNINIIDQPLELPFRCDCVHGWLSAVFLWLTDGHSRVHSPSRPLTAADKHYPPWPCEY